MLEERRNELVRILNKGFEFQVTEIVKVYSSWFHKLINKSKKEEIVHTFLVREPTLSILDHISIESSAFNEQDFNNLQSEADIKKYTREHLRAMAKIIAIIVSGPEFDKYDLKKKTSLFFKYLKPSDLFNIIQIADIASNLGDFINSTRYVAAANVLNQPKADPVEETTA